MAEQTVGKSPLKERLTSTPLPPGWEAKYDYHQKRYFFVDHQNKITTWEDPRIKVLEQQQRDDQRQRNDESAGSGMWSHSSKLDASSHLRSNGSHTQSTTGGWQSQIEDKYGMKVEIIKDDGDADPEAVMRIMARFPTAGRDLINLIMADGLSEEDIYLKLPDMGYKEQRPATPSDSGGVHKGSPGHHEQSTTSCLKSDKSGGRSTPSDLRGVSPDRHIRSASPGHKSDKAGRSTPSDLKGISPDPHPKHTTFSNVNDRRSASPGRPKGKGSTHKSHQSGQAFTSKASPLVEVNSEKRRKLQEKLEQEFKNYDKSVIESTLSSCSYDEEKARFELQLLRIAKSALTTTTSDNVKTSATNESNKATQSVPAADSITSAKSVPENNTVEGERSDSSSSCRRILDEGRYVSHSRIETKGPDVSLVKGPNKQLLLSDYVTDVGSQSANYHGPCKENYHGPCAELCKGPQLDAAKGPAAVL